MPKRSSSDINETAFRIVQQSTGQAAPTILNRKSAKQTVAIYTSQPIAPVAEKNPAAVALGRLGGLKGGKARADSLSNKRKKEIARSAAQARWKNKKS
jgi:hypothetical protein